MMLTQNQQAHDPFHLRADEKRWKNVKSLGKQFISNGGGHGSCLSEFRKDIAVPPYREGRSYGTPDSSFLDLRMDLVQ